MRSGKATINILEPVSFMNVMEVYPNRYLPWLMSEFQHYCENSSRFFFFNANIQGKEMCFPVAIFYITGEMGLQRKRRCLGKEEY